MKILHIVKINHLGNGIAAVVLDLSLNQRKIGEDVKVLNLNHAGADISGFEKCLKEEDFTLCLDSFNPDIVIIHSVFYKELKRYSSLLRERSIPYLIELHGAFSHENYRKNKIKKWIYKRLYLEKFLKNSQGLIFLNESEQNNFALKGYELNEYIIPNGCYPHENVKRSTEKIIFLYLGRIAIYHKGLDNLLSALRLLQEEGIDDNVSFIFYGPGYQKDLDWFKEQIKGFGKNIEYRGPVYGEEKYTAYKTANLFILPSRFEGFPVSVLDALSFGLPCLITNETNCAHIIKGNNCGWVINPNTPEKIMECIKLAIKEYRKNGELLSKNAVKASTEYLWEAVAKDSVELYRKVIKDY